MTLKPFRRKRRRVLSKLQKTDALAAIFTATKEIIKIARQSDPTAYEEAIPRDRYPLRDQTRKLFGLPPFNYERDYVDYRDVRQQIHSTIDRTLQV